MGFSNEGQPVGATVATETPASAARPGAELEPGQMVGEYQVEGLLGEGGMGRVYAAIHPLIAKRVAIKVLRPELSDDPSAVERFVREARSVNQIGHPNIVDIFAFGALPDGRHYFVMEWLQGESLRARLSRGPLSLGEALGVLDAIASALGAAHATGIVHRDLKPDNVFMASNGVKLVDFGIAKLLGNEPGIDHTATGALIGTPSYMSPEQARGELVDTRSDLYALGAVAFEVLTGERVFRANTAAEMVARHLFETPRTVRELRRDVRPALDALVTALLAKEMTARPTLAVVRETLARTRDEPVAKSTARTGSSRRIAIIVASAVAVTAIGITVIASWPTPTIALPTASPPIATPVSRPAVIPTPVPAAATGSAAARSASAAVTSGSAEVARGSAASGSAASGSAATAPASHAPHHGHRAPPSSPTAPIPSDDPDAPL